nr:response regulator transcription factor [Dyella sp. A6]
MLIVDDHPMVRDGLRSMLSREPDLDIAGEATHGREAIAQYRALRPDLMLIDLQMPEMDGLQAIAAIRDEFPDAAIIVLTTFLGDARVARAFALGATAYLLKTARSHEIIRAIRNALIGRRTMAADVAEQVAQHMGHEALTERETSILRLVAKGQSNRSIAGVLHLSEDTIKARMKSIMRKLNAGDRTHAAMIALGRGYIDPVQ